MSPEVPDPLACKLVIIGSVLDVVRSHAFKAGEKVFFDELTENEISAESEVDESEAAQTLPEGDIEELGETHSDGEVPNNITLTDGEVILNVGGDGSPASSGGVFSRNALNRALSQDPTPTTPTTRARRGRVLRVLSILGL